MTAISTSTRAVRMPCSRRPRRRSTAAGRSSRRRVSARLPRICLGGVTCRLTGALRRRGSLGVDDCHVVSVACPLGLPACVRSVATSHWPAPHCHLAVRMGHLASGACSVASGPWSRLAGVVMKKPGFTAVMPWREPLGEPLPPFSVGTSVPLEQCDLHQVTLLPSHALLLQQDDCPLSPSTNAVWGGGPSHLHSFASQQCGRLSSSPPFRFPAMRLSLLIATLSLPAGPNVAPGLPDRVGADRVDGEERHRNGRIHPHTHQQHRRAQLRPHRGAGTLLSSPLPSPLLSSPSPSLCSDDACAPAHGASSHCRCRAAAQSCRRSSGSRW